jgi:hypothetical protein
MRPDPRSHKPQPSESSIQPRASGREIQLPLDREALLDLMQDSLESLALELGLLAASGLPEDEVTCLCGPRYQCVK